MLFSEDQLDQLLSGYLDDALEPSQRSSLEELLQNDSELGQRARDQLSEMQTVRQSLQQLFQHDAGLKLDHSFADRVINEAVSRAREEGLATDHPLVRVAEQPMRAPHSGNTVWNRNAIMSALAVAASISLIVWSISMRDIANLGVTDGAVASRPTDSGTPTATSTDSIEDGNVQNSALAVDDDAALTDLNLVEDTEVIAMEPSGSKTIAANSDRQGSSGPSTPSMRSQRGISSSDRSPLNNDSIVSTAPTVASRLAAVIVLDVRQSAQGRDLNSVGRALSAAEISVSSKKPVNASIAGVATKAAGVSSDQRISLMYLEASAQKLDHFYMALLGDRDGIESVSLSLATDAPIMNSIAELQPEDRTVAATELQGNAQTMEGLVKQVDQLQFMPLNRDIAATMSQSNQADVETAILVIVR